MNRRSSAWTGRTPRGLEEAFGPHTARRIDEPAQSVPAHEIALYLLFVAVAVLLSVLLLMEGT